MKIRTSNGVELTDESLMTVTMNGYAKQKGVAVHVFETSLLEYLIVKGDMPVFSSPRAEDIAARIDMMALDIEFGGDE